MLCHVTHSSHFLLCADTDPAINSFAAQNWTSHLGFTETEALEFTRQEDPQFLVNAIKTMPMGRLGTVREISNCIMWLLSDEASYVTGTIIDAAGGRTTA